MMKVKKFVSLYLVSLFVRCKLFSYLLKSFLSKLVVIILKPWSVYDLRQDRRGPVPDSVR